MERPDPHPSLITFFFAFYCLYGRTSGALISPPSNSVTLESCDFELRMPRFSFFRSTPVRFSSFLKGSSFSRRLAVERLPLLPVLPSLSPLWTAKSSYLCFIFPAKLPPSSPLAPCSSSGERSFERGDYSPLPPRLSRTHSQHPD